MRRATASLLLSSVLTLSSVSFTPAAGLRHEFRALWVDTFNTTLNTHADVVRIVSSARAARMNVLLAQVRRRGDAWYLVGAEPPPDFTPIEPGFDPLADLLATAHSAGIQVHAYVIAGAIWNKDPALSPPANGPPLDPRHVFNQHGGYDSATRTVVQGPSTWLTRTLLPDGPGIAYQGHRINGEFWLDFGHPDAAAYTVQVLTQLVSNYDVDGLHLDRIRYPELTASGQTPSAGANIGYNAVSVARFQRRYGISAATTPSPGDLRWADWRRAQVTNLVRRIYLNCAAIKPGILISAALIAFGGGPATDQAWQSAEAYWRVYQDWRAWLAEGILDVAIPMNYKREHDALQAAQFDQWMAFAKSHQYNRAALVGVGAFLNGVEGTLRQVRRSLAADRDGQALGVAFFSLANASDAVVNNPFALPPGQTSPKRDFGDLAAALTTGGAIDGRSRYELPMEPVFQDEALAPVLSWKIAPRVGHVMGYATLDDGTLLDGVAVRLVDLRAGIVRGAETDGGGFFGFVDVEPGAYALAFAKAGPALRTMRIDVQSGHVTSVVLTATP
ncbi:MAG TPA: family 10 glycosylhydrolase [Vicinamibacterales bacterium]|nr:family 10 glycosylhydrolase [Vicinamibacterales bacterium]